MKSRDKGHLGVLKVELRAIEKGWIVSRPTHDDCRYDLVLDDGARLYRAQVKYSGTKSSNSENSIPVKLNRVGNKGQSLGGYQAEDVDVILAYLAEIDRVVWIPISEVSGKKVFSIRTAPPLNGQNDGIHLLEDYVW